MLLLGRDVERSLSCVRAACRLPRRICFALEQQLHATRPVELGSVEKRALSILAELVDISAMVEQQRYDAVLSQHTRVVQWRATQVVCLVNARFVLDEELRGFESTVGCSTNQRGPVFPPSRINVDASIEFGFERCDITFLRCGVNRLILCHDLQQRKLQHCNERLNSLVVVVRLLSRRLSAILRQR